MTAEPVPPRPLSRRDTAGWVMVTGGAQGVRVVVTLLSAAILARLLSPADFGLIAAASPILAFTALLQNLGLNEALVQWPHLQKKHISALFYITIAASAALATALYLLAPLLAHLLSDPRLVEIIRAIAVVALLTAVASTPMGLLNRRLKFGQLAIIDIVASVSGLVVGVSWALLTHNYWALVSMQIVTALVQGVGSFIFAGWRPGAATFDGEFRKMVGLGAGFSTFNMLNFLSRNADILLIARFHGATGLGFYDRAYKLMLFPLWQSITPFGRVLTPVLARLQDDAVAYRARYFEATAFLMSVVQPGIVAAVVFSDLTVRVILGPGWTASGPIFFWLGLTALQQIYTLTLGWLFISQGRGKELALLGAVGATIAVASFIVGLPYGPMGVAMAYAIGDICLRAPITWWFAGRRGPVSTIGSVAQFVPHLAAMAASGGLLAILSRIWEFDGILHLGAAVMLSYAIYLPVLCLFPGKRRFAATFTQGVLRRLRPGLL